MTEISFKSAGELNSDTVSRNNSQRSVSPIGIKTPLRLGNDSDGIFSMNYDLKEQIRDNLKNLILTNSGERLGFYDFGANLLELANEVTSNTKEDFDFEAISRIKSTVSKYLPYIDLETFESSIDNDNNEHTGKILIKIIYNIPELNIEKEGLQIVIFAGG